MYLSMKLTFLSVPKIITINQAFLRCDHQMASLFGPPCINVKTLQMSVYKKNAFFRLCLLSPSFSDGYVLLSVSLSVCSSVCLSVPCEIC